MIMTSITTTKSGRASKPSTPALQSFPAEPIRSRSSRTALEQTGTNNKRSHKKGAGQAAQLIAAQQHNAADDEASKAAGQSDEEDLEIDADEPTYCYCNGVSYGEMVACDADGCAKEWFHLDCVGLKVAPKGNGKLLLSLLSYITTCWKRTVAGLLTLYSEMVLRRLQREHEEQQAL
jgi:hypothetical protein